MKIRINGIFHKYNNEVDLDKRLSIYIGENGIGKSTTLKIINCILNCDFYNILKYEFESFSLEGNTFTISDLIPSKEEFINIGRKNNILDKDYYNIFEDINEEEYINDFYKEFVRNDLINDYLDNIVVNRLYKEYSSDYEEGVNIFKKNIDRFKNYFNKKNKAFLDEINKKYKNVLYINMVRDYKIDYRIKYYIDDEIDINIKNNYQFKSSEESMVLFYKEVLSKNKKMSDEYLNENADDLYNEFLKYRKQEITDILKVYMKEYQKVNKTEYLNSVNKSLKKLFSKNPFSLLNKHSINLSLFLLKISLAPENVLDIISNYYSYIVSGKFSDILKEELNSDDYLIDTKFYREYGFIKTNLLPLLPKSSFFNVMFHKNERLFTKVLIRFCIEIELIDYNSLNNLLGLYFDYNGKAQFLMSKIYNYLDNKSIRLTPTSIEILDNGTVDFEQLSEGEKKIIFILLISSVFDNITLLLDEPETSLSILWQERLIKDLLSNSNINNIVVATQSPYIINDDMIDNIVPLNGVDSNE